MLGHGSSPWKRKHGAGVTAMIAALAVLASVLLSGAGAATARHSSGPVGSGSAHWFGPGGFGDFGQVSARPPAVGFAPTVVDNLTNPGNNEIMPTTNTHLIFWLPAGFHYSAGITAATDLAYQNQIIRYFQDVGGSQILNTTTQYCGRNGCPANTSTFVDSIVDTTAFPDTGADAAHSITQTNLNTDRRHLLAEQPGRLQRREDAVQHEHVLRLPHPRLVRL